MAQEWSVQDVVALQLIGVILKTNRYGSRLDITARRIFAGDGSGRNWLAQYSKSFCSMSTLPTLLNR